MRFYTTLAAALLTASALLGQSTTTPPRKTTTPPARIPVHTSTTRSTTAHPAASIQQSSSRKAAPRQSAASRYTPRQSGPTPERYKEIQEALISKGYMQGPATGAWDQNSMDAMRKFQSDQKQDPTGKVTAKALIDLGLGPKDETPPPTTNK
jgi:hypothetical protein